MVSRFIAVLYVCFGLMTAPDRISDLIYRSARTYNVDPKLVAAVILQESGGYPYAYRREPGFRRRYIDGKTKARLGGHWPSAISEESERDLRSASIGAMQIMGQKAREAGFTDESLLELVDLEKNIQLGTKVLARFLHLTNGDPERALLKWNGGADKDYPIEVLAHIETGEIDRILIR